MAEIVKAIFDDGQELQMCRCKHCSHHKFIDYKCIGCELKEANRKIRDARASVQLAASALHQY